MKFMKKGSFLLAVVCMLVFPLTGCSEGAVGDYIDLVPVRNTSMYLPRVQDMLYKRSELYLGKTVKVQGEFAMAPFDGRQCTFLILEDVCCRAGDLEVECETDPALGCFVEVEGTFCKNSSGSRDFYYLDVTSLQEITNEV